MRIVLRHDMTVDGLVARLPQFRRVDSGRDESVCRLAGKVPGRTACLHLYSEDPRAIHFDLDDSNAPTLDWEQSSEHGRVSDVGDLVLVLQWWLTPGGEEREPVKLRRRTNR